MIQQLMLDLEVSDKQKNLSLTPEVSDAQIQSIQRFCRFKDSATPHVNTYSPGHRKAAYYRLSWKQGKRVKHVHIPGGNVKSELAQYRAKKLQAMCDRGAELGEILAAVETYRDKK